MKNIIIRIIEKISYLILSTKTNRKIIKKINKYDYISFDIFDTLIKRKTKRPEEVFSIIEEKFNIENFKKNRIAAEKNARRKSKEEEITIDDIYKELKVLNSKQQNNFKKIELETELEECFKNNKIYEIYKYCVDNNKKIIITSDMYMPVNFIKKLLKQNEYTEYEKIYLSSAEKLTKKSGKIYKKIIEDLNIDNNQIIHIGDNPISDYLNAKKNGIKPILITK